MANFRIVPNHESDIYVDYCYPEGVLVPDGPPPKTMWNSYIETAQEMDANDYIGFSTVLIEGLCEKNLETKVSIYNMFSDLIEDEYPIYSMDDIESIMDDTTCDAYQGIWDAYVTMLEVVVFKYHKNGDRVFQ
tara:strand:- start:403 stop:801 length:399 start_codon:yes stop_codon:yes gene_type:complete